MLDQAGEAVGDAPCGAAIEAEDELVEIGGQMLAADGAVVGSLLVDIMGKQHGKPSADIAANLGEVIAPIRTALNG